MIFPSVNPNACGVRAKYYPASDSVVFNKSPILFVNQSLLAENFSWLVNGEPVANTQDFLFYPSLGVNEIKLAVSNGICSDTTVSYVIMDGNLQDQYGSYQKQFNPSDKAMDPFCIASDKYGGYLLAGSSYLPSDVNFKSRTTCLIHIDEKGCVNWAKAMIAGELEVVQTILSTSDSGFIVSAFPYQSPQDNYPGHLNVFKLDKFGNKEWAHAYSNGSAVNNYFSAICETHDGFILEVGSFPVSANPTFISIYKINSLGQFIWGIKLNKEDNCFYNVGGLVVQDQSVYATGSIYQGSPPFGLIRSFVMQLGESTGQLKWSRQNDPAMPPLTFTDNHQYKNGLLINSYNAQLLNTLIYTDYNGNVKDSWIVNNPYGSLNGKQGLLVTKDYSIYFHQPSGPAGAAQKDILLRLDSNLQILWQHDFSSGKSKITDWFQLSSATQNGVAAISSGVLSNGFNALDFMKLDSSGQSCTAGDATLRVDGIAALTDPMTWNNAISFSMTVTDPEFTLDDISIESGIYCPGYLRGCDLLKLEGPRIVCKAGDSVVYFLHQDPNCSSPVKLTYDEQSVSVLSNKSPAIILRFSHPGEYVIKVEKNECVRVMDSMIISVGIDLPVSHLPRDTVLCLGYIMPLDAGNEVLDYLWQDGSGNQIFEAADTGTYWAQLTGKNGCRRTDTTRISSIQHLPELFLPGDTVICKGEKWLLHTLKKFTSYAWNTNDAGDSTLISEAGEYRLQVVDQYGCAGMDSIEVETKFCPFGVYFPNAFTPNQDGINDIFKPGIIGSPVQFHFSIYNRWGQKIFETSNTLKGWDGKLKNKEQASGAYIWICNYQFEGEKEKISEGSFVLLR